jgi:hypothetical protein
MLLDVPLDPITRQGCSFVSGKGNPLPMVATEALSRPFCVILVTRTGLPFSPIATFFSPFFHGLWGTLYKWLSIIEHLEEVVCNVNAARFFRFARRLSAAAVQQ